jgi:hypothetical protein
MESRWYCKDLGSRNWENYDGKSEYLTTGELRNQDIFIGQNVKYLVLSPVNPSIFYVMVSKGRKFQRYSLSRIRNETKLLRFTG